MVPPSPSGGKRATSQLLLFVSESCPISRKMIPIAREFCRSENIDLLFFGDDREDVQTALIQEFGLNPTRFINSESYGRTIGIDKLPYALLAGQDGRLIARGLVNSREHLESLMTVQETGFDTVQSWLATRDARTA
jgi:methylamine dehydrogenase accessory protein MauD